MMPWWSIVIIVCEAELEVCRIRSFVLPVNTTVCTIFSHYRYLVPGEPPKQWRTWYPVARVKQICKKFTVTTGKLM